MSGVNGLRLTPDQAAAINRVIHAAGPEGLPIRVGGVAAWAAGLTEDGCTLVLMGGGKLNLTAFQQGFPPLHEQLLAALGKITTPAEQEDIIRRYGEALARLPLDVSYLQAVLAEMYVRGDAETERRLTEFHRVAREAQAVTEADWEGRERWGGEPNV